DHCRCRHGVPRPVTVAPAARALAGATLWAASAGAAGAREALPGPSALVTGMVHLFTVPDNVLALLGLGLVLGMGGSIGWRRAGACYLAGLAVAAILVLVTTVPAPLWQLALVLALWFGLMAAAALRPPARLVSALAAAAGFAV